MSRNLLGRLGLEGSLGGTPRRLENHTHGWRVLASLCLPQPYSSNGCKVILLRGLLTAALN